MHSFSTVISKPNQLYWLYTLGLVAGLVWLDMYLMATLLLTCWTVLSVGQTVLEVHVPTRSYRSGLRILGIHMGGWRPLPSQAERVVVRYYSEFGISGTDGGGEKAHRHEEYLVLLSVPSAPKGFIIYRDYNYERAVVVAQQLGWALNLDVVDYNRYQQQHLLQEAEARAENS